MDAGDTFRRGSGAHLWIVLSDPAVTPHAVVVVNVTSCRNSRHDDTACLLNVGEHSFIKHPSYVAYSLAKLRTNRELDREVSSGALQLEAPVSPDLLARIRESAAQSDRIPIGILDVLQKQGWVP